MSAENLTSLDKDVLVFSDYAERRARTVELDPTTKLLVEQQPVLTAKLVKLQGVPSLGLEDEARVRATEWELFGWFRKQFESGPIDSQTEAKLNGVVEVVAGYRPPLREDFTPEEIFTLQIDYMESELLRSIKPITPFKLCIPLAAVASSSGKRPELDVETKRV